MLCVSNTQDTDQQMRRRIAVIEQKRDRLFDTYAAKAMSLEQFKRKQAQFDGEAASAQKLLDVALDTYDSLDDIATKALSLGPMPPAPTGLPIRSTAD
jgi:hypothetical protein